MDDDFWKAVREKERASSASRRTGALNIALLFGTAVVALTLILTPMLADSSKKSVFASAPADFDTITTGSIPKSDSGKRYTIRRSVLQDTRGSVCVVQGYGVGAGCLKMPAVARWSWNCSFAVGFAQGSRNNAYFESISCR